MLLPQQHALAGLMGYEVATAMQASNNNQPQQNQLQRNIPNYPIVEIKHNSEPFK